MTQDQDEDMPLNLEIWF